MRKRFLGLVILLVLIAMLTNAQPGAELTLTTIEPPSGQHLFLELHAQGVQIYSCAVVGGKPTWKFEGPEAKLTTSDGRLAGKHSSGPSWKLLDGSEVKGSMVATRPARDQGSVPWLLLKVVSHAGEGKLGRAEYVTRTETKGGLSPQSGCDESHAGTSARISYSATCRFYGKQ